MSTEINSPKWRRMGRDGKLKTVGRISDARKQAGCGIVCREGNAVSSTQAAP